MAAFLLAGGEAPEPGAAWEARSDWFSPALDLESRHTEAAWDGAEGNCRQPELAGHYRGLIMHAIATIVNEERIFGLYKGITSPLLTFTLLNGLVFASYKFFLRLQCPVIADASLNQITLAGMGIFKASGFTGLYRGSLSTALRDCGYGAYFASYEATVRTLTPPGGKREVWPVLVAGAVAGIVGWLVTFPLGMVKTRVQGSGPGALLSPGTAPIDLLVFYRGLAPTLIR
ncbi:mitochondrial carrier [Mycena olivaceomarginata]|nr:mitochondrial carrier [Mycena olivaceomarginata]